MYQGYKTFRDIYSAATRYRIDSSTTFQTMMKEQINRAYERAVDAHDWTELRKVAQSGITLPASSAHIYLPAYVGQILAIVDTANDWFLEPGRIENLAYMSPSEFIDSGSTVDWAAAGDSGIAADFSPTAETLNIVSSSASDTTQTVRLHGLIANNIEVTETVALNGTTNVVSTNTFTDLYSASTDDTHVGTISATGVTSSTVYLRVPPADKTVRYKRIRLRPPSSVANALAIVYKKAVRPLVNDQDVPEIPVYDYLIEMGIAFGYGYDGNEASAAKHEQMAGQLLQIAINKSAAGGDDRIQSRPAQPARTSGGLKIFRPNA